MVSRRRDGIRMFVKHRRAAFHPPQNATHLHVSRINDLTTFGEP